MIEETLDTAVVPSRPDVRLNATAYCRCNVDDIEAETCAVDYRNEIESQGLVFEDDFRALLVQDSGMGKRSTLGTLFCCCFKQRRFSWTCRVFIFLLLGSVIFMVLLIAAPHVCLYTPKSAVPLGAYAQGENRKVFNILFLGDSMLSKPIQRYATKFPSPSGRSHYEFRLHSIP